MFLPVVTIMSLFGEFDFLVLSSFSCPAVSFVSVLDCDCFVLS